jgi:hypothetical protein
MDAQLEKSIAAHKVIHRGFEIRVKRDFGNQFHLIDGMPCMWGYVVVKDGCNAMPGATWFQTVKAAKRGIDALFDVGGANAASDDHEWVQSWWLRVRENA